MKRLTVEAISKAINGKVMQGSPDVWMADVVYFSEKIKQHHTLLFKRPITNDIDWELIGKSPDYAIVAQKNEIPSLPVGDYTLIVVDDIEEAFYQFVDYYRNLFDIPVIAVTGTCGKSTSKEMIKHILEGRHSVQATYSSNNSFYRNLPYLLGIDEHTDAAVFETAVGRPGQLSYHCCYFKPTIGVITNIGMDHLDWLHTLDAYIHAKAEMLQGLDNQGILVINADCPNIAKIDMSAYRGRIVKIGVQHRADIRASDITFGQGGMNFTLHLQKMRYPIFIPGYGEHQVYNALIAIAVVHQLGIDIREAAQRLVTFRNISRRLEFTQGMNGCTIIDDTWHSNPPSLESALQTLQGVKQGKKSVLLVGDMDLFGKQNEEVHRQVGQMIAKYDVDVVVTLGSLGEEIANSLVQSQSSSQVYMCNTADQVFELFTELLDEQTILLLKITLYEQKRVSELHNMLEKVKQN